jgi:hypothetical protein
MGPPIRYTRRLEGLLQDGAKPVLEGDFSHSRLLYKF